MNSLSANNTFSSCYGAKPIDDCYTCDSVKKAYDDKIWKYNSSDFKQCNPATTNIAPLLNNTFSSCYGAKPVDDCYTCDSVKKAYDDKIWKYNSSDFKQCNPATTNIAPPLNRPQIQSLDNSSTLSPVWGITLFFIIFIIFIIFAILQFVNNTGKFIDFANTYLKSSTLR
jgi:hypothetical protein